MKNEKILLVGGEGFIGRNLQVRLAEVDASFKSIDNYNKDAHHLRKIKLDRKVIIDLNRITEVIHFIKDYSPTTIVYLASETGTGISNSDFYNFTNSNCMGLASLLEACRIAQCQPYFILTSSRAVYGEGCYKKNDGEKYFNLKRDQCHLDAGCFEVFKNGEPLKFLPNNIDQPPTPISIYGYTKLYQEALLTTSSEISGYTIFRLQNVYGAGQNVFNSYTGILNQFVDKALKGSEINIFEDGEMIRDYVYVDDVTAAVIEAIKRKNHNIKATFDLGSGEPTTTKQLTALIFSLIGTDKNFSRVSGDYRLADIRHAYCNPTKAMENLSWVPKVSLQRGLLKLIDSFEYCV